MLWIGPVQSGVFHNGIDLNGTILEPSEIACLEFQQLLPDCTSLFQNADRANRVVTSQSRLVGPPYRRCVFQWRPIYCLGTR